MNNGAMRMAVDYEGDMRLDILERGEQDTSLGVSAWIGQSKVLSVYTQDASPGFYEEITSPELVTESQCIGDEEMIRSISFPYERVNAAISMAMDSLLLDELHERGIELESNFAKALIALGIFKLTAINIIGDTPEKLSEVVQYEGLGECFSWRNTIQGASFWVTKDKEVSEYMEGLKHGT